MTLRFTADATWHALVGAHGLLVVEPSAGAELAVLTPALDGDDALTTVLDGLLARGVAAAPAFALVTWTGSSDEPGELRIVVRGEVSAIATSADGEVRVSGSGVRTWNERSATAVTGFRLRTPAGEWSAGSCRSSADGELAADGDLPVAGDLAASGVAGLEPREQVAPIVAVPDPEATIVPGVVDALADDEVEPPVPGPALGAVGAPGSDGEYDQLFGDTLYRTVSGAAVRDEEEDDEDASPFAAPPLVPALGGASASAAPEATREDEGDHDGMTVMTEDVRALRAGARAAGGDVAPTPAPAPASAPETAFALELGTGAIEPLTRPVVVGRAPSASAVSGGEVPKLLTIGGDDQDISRTHARVAVEGGTVVVTDLHSRNGTLVTIPGKPPQRLRAGEPTSVLTGSVIDFGGGVTLTVREV